MKKINLEWLIAIILLLISISIFCIDGINYIQNSIIGFDEGYNATVSKNYATNGEYRVSYPYDIIFYNIISTGQTVLLPTAILYKIFGINPITTSIVPLVYGILCFVALFIIFNLILKEKLKDFKYIHILSAVLTSLILMTEESFYYCSVHLIGESAALFFVLMCIIALSLFKNNKNSMFMLLAGFFAIAAFLTKSSMIFILVSLIGMLLIETIITKKLKIKDFCFFIFGIIISFILLDSIKFIQLGGLYNYFGWYRREWFNMLNQSGDGGLLPLNKKMITLSSMINHSYLITIIVILLPVIIYLLRILKVIIDKEELDFNLPILYGGVAGSSLLVFFILLGHDGLNVTRRLIVNKILVRIYAVFFAICIVAILINYLKKKNKNKKIIIVCSIITTIILGIILFPFYQINTAIDCYTKKQTEKEYDVQLMEQFLSKVNALPKEATLYVPGHLQEANITLFLNRKMINLGSVTKETVDRKNGYLIIGRRFDKLTTEGIDEKWNIKLKEVGNINVDYELLNDSRCLEIFRIYKIE